MCCPGWIVKHVTGEHVRHLSPQLQLSKWPIRKSRRANVCFPTGSELRRGGGKTPLWRTVCDFLDDLKKS